MVSPSGGCGTSVYIGDDGLSSAGTLVGPVSAGACGAHRARWSEREVGCFVRRDGRFHAQEAPRTLMSRSEQWRTYHVNEPGRLAEAMNNSSLA